MGAEPTAKGKSDYGSGHLARPEEFFIAPTSSDLNCSGPPAPRGRTCAGPLATLARRRSHRTKESGQTLLIRLSCADDDAQGNRLEVLWDYELDRLILEEEGWADLASKGFDQPRQFAAFLHTLRWNCISATEPNLFQAPFRAGIKIDA